MRIITRYKPQGRVCDLLSSTRSLVRAKRMRGCDNHVITVIIRLVCRRVPTSDLKRGDLVDDL